MCYKNMKTNVVVERCQALKQGLAPLKKPIPLKKLTHKQILEGLASYGKNWPSEVSNQRIPQPEVL